MINKFLTTGLMCNCVCNKCVINRKCYSSESSLICRKFRKLKPLTIMHCTWEAKLIRIRANLFIFSFFWRWRDLRCHFEPWRWKFFQWWIFLRPWPCDRNRSLIKSLPSSFLLRNVSMDHLEHPNSLHYKKTSSQETFILNESVKETKLP